MAHVLPSATAVSALLWIIVRYFLPKEIADTLASPVIKLRTGIRMKLSLHPPPSASFRYSPGDSSSYSSKKFSDRRDGTNTIITTASDTRRNTSLFKFNNTIMLGVDVITDDDDDHHHGYHFVNGTTDSETDTDSEKVMIVPVYSDFSRIGSWLPYEVHRRWINALQRAIVEQEGKINMNIFSMKPHFAQVGMNGTFCTYIENDNVIAAFHYKEYVVLKKNSERYDYYATNKSSAELFLILDVVIQYKQKPQLEYARSAVTNITGYDRFWSCITVLIAVIDILTFCFLMYKGYQLVHLVIFRLLRNFKINVDQRQGEGAEADRNHERQGEGAEADSSSSFHTADGEEADGTETSNSFSFPGSWDPYFEKNVMWYDETAADSQVVYCIDLNTLNSYMSAARSGNLKMYKKLNSCIHGHVKVASQDKQIFMKVSLDLWSKICTFYQDDLIVKFKPQIPSVHQGINTFQMHVVSCNKCESTKEKKEFSSPGWDISFHKSLAAPVWVLWFSTNDLRGCFKYISVFSVIEDIYRSLDNYVPASSLSSGSQYLLAQGSISPSLNMRQQQRDGLVVRLDRSHRNKIDSSWLDLMICLVAKKLGLTENSVHGASVVMLDKFAEISLYIKDDQKEIGNLIMKHLLGNKLGLDFDELERQITVLRTHDGEGVSMARSRSIV